MSRIDLTLIFIPIIPDYIETALKTLYEKAPPNLNFRVIVVDQTKDGIYGLVKDYADLVIRNPNPLRTNMGFSKANNEAIVHALHWSSKYIACCNDDIEFIDSRWWQGIIDQFETFPEMFAVCPASPIEAGFGYGLNEDGTWVTGNSCPDWGVQVEGNVMPKKPDGTAITYEECKTPEGYDMLLAHRQGHIEGFAGWFVVFKRETLETVGLYDERFGPGNGEDYDMVHRIYIAGGRASATMKSFVWHWWGKSKKAVGERADIAPFTKPRFGDTNALFVHAPDGANSPIFPPRDNELFGNKRKRKNPGVFIEDIR